MLPSDQSAAPAWQPTQSRSVAGRRYWFAARERDDEAEHDAHMYETVGEAQARCELLNEVAPHA